MSTATETSTAAAGLRGVVAAQSAIGDVNGEDGILIYQGYDIHDLAEHATFEEVIFLLWNGRLPQVAELTALTAEIRANYEAPAEVLALMQQFPKTADPMDVLRTAVSALDFYDKDGHGTDREHAMKAAIKLTAQERPKLAQLKLVRGRRLPEALQDALGSSWTIWNALANPYQPTSQIWSTAAEGFSTAPILPSPCSARR